MLVLHKPITVIISVILDHVVTTWMGDCLRTGKQSRYIANTKLNSASFSPGYVNWVLACMAGVMAGHIHLCPRCVIPYGRWCSVALRWVTVKSCRQPLISLYSTWCHVCVCVALFQSRWSTAVSCKVRSHCWCTVMSSLQRDNSFIVSHQVYIVNSGDNAFTRCVSVCQGVCVCVSVPAWRHNDIDVVTSPADCVFFVTSPAAMFNCSHS